MLSISPSVGYIHEPFRLRHSSGICAARFSYWFPYISRANEVGYLEHIRSTLQFRYNLVGGLKTIGSVEDAKRVLGECGSFLFHRLCRARPLVKDPLAVLSASWLAETFGMEVVVLIRHPAAFVGSLKRLGWKYPFSHFLMQPLLMRDYLSSFEEQIREYADGEYDIIDQAILLWRIFNSVVVRYRGEHKHWIFVRHEDLSRDPIRGFERLFGELDLDFSRRARSVVVKHSTRPDLSDVSEYSTYTLQRDSGSNMWTWKSRLSESEVRRVKEGVGDLSGEFYSDEDW